jgi:hypothetical protein
MKILCHRGYWKTAAEKNTAVAFKRGYDLGLGTETDLRDLGGKLVISHDPPNSEATTFDDFLSMTPRDVLLALNIKSDGLASQALEALKKHGHQDYVFFDMSVPDMRSYIRLGAPVAVRLSEYEPWVDDLMAEASFIWLDAFWGDWYDRAYLAKLLMTNKQILVVSSELHGRAIDAQWALLDSVSQSDKLTLCTDFPEIALKRFCV